MKHKLTKPQLEELRQLAREPQRTYGRARARVQNNLAKLGLAYYCEEDGSRPVRSIFQILASYGTAYPQCRITDVGKRALLALNKKR